MKEQKTAIAELALLFAEKHIKDDDCLGEAARKLYYLLDNVYPGLIRPDDIDC